MLTLDLVQVLRFLDALDPEGRHTLASEAPFGAPAARARNKGSWPISLRSALSSVEQWPLA